MASVRNVVGYSYADKESRVNAEHTHTASGVWLGMARLDLLSLESHNARAGSPVCWSSARECLACPASPVSHARVVGIMQPKRLVEKGCRGRYSEPRRSSIDPRLTERVDANEPTRIDDD